MNPADTSTLLILPCSGEKDLPADPMITPSGRTVFDLIERTANQLRAGREGCARSVLWSSPMFAALDYYNGHFYRVPGLREELSLAIRSARANVLILSGAYGMVLPDEPIHNYDLQMNAAYWLSHGLNDAVGELVETTRSPRIVAFLAKSTAYAKIIREVNWQQLRALADVRESGLFTVDSNGLNDPRRNVPRLLGEAVVKFLRSGNPLVVERIVLQPL